MDCLAPVHHRAPELRGVPELVATLGDRIALDRFVLAGGPAGQGFEIEHMGLNEVDGDGRLRTVMLFDPDDRAAATLEALQRFAAGEGAATGGQGPYVAFARAFQRHDWEAVRQVLAPDLTFVDHRTLGFGMLDRDQWVASMRTQAELSPDLARTCSGYPPGTSTASWSRRAHSGPWPDGGPFENVFVIVVLTAGDRIQQFEAFDLADTVRAVARFEELCAARTS